MKRAIIILAVLCLIGGCGAKWAIADDPAVVIGVRDYTPCPDSRLAPADCDGQDGAYLLLDKPIDPAKTALVIVDAWAEHDNADLVARIATNVESSLYPLLQAVRADGRLTIIHYRNGRALHPLIVPEPGEIVADYGEDVINTLLGRDIRTVIFAGYAANMCLVNRPASIMWLWHKHGRYQQGNIIVVRDATVAIGSPDISPDEARRNVMLFLEINNYATTATVADVAAALQPEPVIEPVSPVATPSNNWLPLVAKGEDYD